MAHWNSAQHVLPARCNSGTAWLCVRQVRKLAFEVRLYIEAAAVAEQCSVIATSSTTIEIDKSFGFFIVARDVEGLPLETGRSTFMAYAFWEGTHRTLEQPLLVAYDPGKRSYTGVYQDVERVRAQVVITVLLNGINLPDVLIVDIVCQTASTGTVVPSLLTPDGRCGCPAGYAVDGQVQCVICAAGTTSAPGGMRGCNITCAPGECECIRIQSHAVPFQWTRATATSIRDCTRAGKTRCRAPPAEQVPNCHS